MVAVNNLAVLNETFGYHVGDEVIASIAKAIKEKLRGGDSIGRYSSNKFGVILNDCGPGAMRIAAERFMKAIRSLTIRTNQIQLSVTISIGGVSLPDHANTVHQAIGGALQALDRAKDRRSDCFMVFEPNQSLESSRLRNVAIVDEVISALAANRMRLVLQPLIEAKTGRPGHYECLLRMMGTDGKTVSAGEFIPIAEQLGLSRLIDRRTLELTIDILQAYPKVHLSLNVSSLTSSDHEWVVALHRLTRGKPEFLKRLTLEITETAAIHDVDQTRAFVDMLREFGCKVAIDDFGAGYTSFKNLKALNANMVKIDGAFVKHLTEDASDQVFIKSMVELARTFNMETVAEWVGDQATADFLIDAGITYLQGFHYGQPIEVSELEAYEAKFHKPAA
jgi:diguanylate cyclase (GGDEF)-like protein